MKINDAANGVLALVFGAAIIALSGEFAELRHIDYGPGLFPTLVGAGLVAAGALLILRWLVARNAGTAGAGEGPADAPRYDKRSMFLTVLAVVFYILAVDFLGFLVTMTAVLICMIWWFDRRIPHAVIIGVAGTLVIHGFFYQLMSVPLPWGLLEPFAQVLTW